jgi:hypothetical protein
MKVWIVWGQTETNRYFVAVATGDKEDIKSYYHDKCGYGPELQEVNVINIRSMDIERLNKLKAEKKEIETRLKELNNLIG